MEKNNNKKIKEIFRQARANPYKMNFEGKQNLAMELTEFMSEKQLDKIIEQVEQRYLHIEKRDKNAT